MSTAYNHLMRYRLPNALQGAYSELLAQLSAEASSEIAAPARATLVRKTLKGKVYWYWQLHVDGQNRQTYLGPDSEPAVQHLLAEMAARNARSTLCDVLRPVYGPALQGPMARVLTALGEARIHATGAVLVGTYAFVAYQGMFALRWPNYAATDDIDLAATAQPADQQIDLQQVLADTRLGFEPARFLDSARPPVMFVLPGQRQRVDVLTPLIGRPNQLPIVVPALRTHGEPLRFLDYLLQDSALTALPLGTGVLMRVPQPARYALHKLLILPRRIDPDKRAKDFAQASSLLAVLVQESPNDLATAWRALCKWPKSWRDGVARQIRLLPADLRGEVEDVLRA